MYKGAERKMNPCIIIGLFLTTFCFGSVGGTAYAVAHGLSEVATILILCLMNAVIVFAWFGIFWAIESRLSNLLEHKRKDFRKTKLTGMLTLSGFTFIFGSLWATIAVYALNLKRKPALISVTTGAVFGGALWTLGSIGIIWFCLLYTSPSPRD